VERATTISEFGDFKLRRRRRRRRYHKTRLGKHGLLDAYGAIRTVVIILVDDDVSPGTTVFEQHGGDMMWAFYIMLSLEMVSCFVRTRVLL
jgi:hypothetical protein